MVKFWKRSFAGFLSSYHYHYHYHWISLEISFSL